MQSKSKSYNTKLVVYNKKSILISKVYIMKKIEGEIFNFSKNNDETIQKTDEEINTKYKKGEIRIVTEQARYPIKNIRGMLESGDYKRNPEYQRRKRWDNGKKSRLIESFIINVPLPPIFLYEYEYSKYEVMDGLQRLTAIDDFYMDGFALVGLEYWQELEGKRYSELPSEIKAGIDRRYLSSIILLQETAKDEKEAQELKQIVFERLNSGGEDLEPQETRNALYPGKFNQLCIELSKNETFKIMWRIPSDEEMLDEKKLIDEKIYRQTEIDRYKTMEDVELVLRFFAFRFVDLYNHKMKDFLDEYLKQANQWSDNTLEELRQLFIDTIELGYNIFGKDAFTHITSNTVTKTIYEPLMQSLSKYLEYKDILLIHKEKINENKFSNDDDLILDNGKELFDGKYAHRGVLVKRIEYFDKLFEKYIK